MTSRQENQGSRGQALADLRARLRQVRAKGAGKPATERARRLLDAYLGTAERHGRPLRDVVADMARGEIALAVGHAVREVLMAEPPEAVKRAACAEGCAFCCILSGGDGGLITEAEAERLHTALAPFAGKPDGRSWHPEACAALDPATRACRVYEARPMICRSFLSTDAAACEANATGGAAAGPGLIGSHLDYLAVLALAREALRGKARVATFSLAQVASGAVAGKDLADCLDAARQAPGALEDACRAAAHAAEAGRRPPG